MQADPPMQAETASEERAVGKGDAHNELAKPIQQPSDVSAAEEMPHITSSAVEVTSDGDSVEISEDSNSVVKQMADEANHQEEKNEPTLGQEPEPEVEGNVESPLAQRGKIVDFGPWVHVIPETWTPSKEFEYCTTLYLVSKT